MSEFLFYPDLLTEMRDEFIAGMVAAIPDDYAWRLTLEMLRRVDRAHASLPQLMFLDPLETAKKAERAIRAYPALYSELWCKDMRDSSRMMALGVELDFFDLRHPAYWTGTMEDKKKIFNGLQSWKCCKVFLANANDETCKHFIPDLHASPQISSLGIGSLKMQHLMASGRTALINQVRIKYDSMPHELGEFDKWMRRVEARSTAATNMREYVHFISQNPDNFLSEFQGALRNKNGELAMEMLATGACPRTLNMWELQGVSEKVDRMALVAAMEKALNRNIENVKMSISQELQFNYDRRSILFFYDLCATRNYRLLDFTLVNLIWKHSDLLPRFKALPQNFPLGSDFMKRAVTHNTTIALQFGLAQGLKMTLDLFQLAFICNMVHILYWLTTHGFTFDKEAMVAFLFNRKGIPWMPTPKMLAYMKYMKMELP